MLSAQEGDPQAMGDKDMLTHGEHHRRYLGSVQRHAHEFAQVRILDVGQSCSVFSLGISLQG